MNNTNGRSSGLTDFELHVWIATFGAFYAGKPSHDSYDWSEEAAQRADKAVHAIRDLERKG